MSDSISIATETTQITNASRRGKKSSIISRRRSKQSSSAAHWTVIVRDGLETGDTIITSDLTAPVPGMNISTGTTVNITP